MGAVQLKMKGFLFEAIALAFWAGFGNGKLSYPFLNFVRAPLLVFLEKIDNSLKSCVPLCTRILHRIYGHLNLVPIQKHLHYGFGKVFYRCTQTAFVMLEECFNLFENPNVPILPKRSNPSSGNAQIRIRKNAFPGNFFDYTQTITAGASSIGRVERKTIGCWLLVRKARFGVHQVLGEIVNFSAFFPYHQHSFAVLQGGFERLGNSKTIVLLRYNAVDDDLNVVDFVAVQLHLWSHLEDDTIYPYLGESQLTHLFKKLSVMSLSPFDNRGQ